MNRKQTTDMMKRSKVLSAVCVCAACAAPLQAQQMSMVHENELAIVYYMPLTQIAVTIEYDEINMQPGVFYQYAERYLGSTDMIVEEQTLFRVTNITTSLRTLADTQRAYKVVAQRGVESQLLALTDEGILYGYNVPPQAAVPCPYRPLMAREVVTPRSMPLLEEQMLANSTAKMAEGAAKQIYQLRETRLNLLSGDVEHAPADGQAMQLVMAELDQREQQLTALFVGSKTIQHHSKTIYYTPREVKSEEIICRFSRYTGVVAPDDLSGEPVSLTVAGQQQALMPAADTKKSGKAQTPSQIYYNLPGSATVLVQYGSITTENTYPVAQYGVAIPLALDLFTADKMPHIYFNTQTGNISSIQK